MAIVKVVEILLPIPVCTAGHQLLCGVMIGVLGRMTLKQEDASIRAARILWSKL